jgi:hypothetical protein
MKYVITTGCSFTNNLRLDPNNPKSNLDENRLSWPYFLGKELGREYEVLNYGGATNDNVSMCRIQLYHLKRLISDGVNPTDITLITQWSDPTRQSIYLTKKFTKEQHHLGHTLVYTPKWETENGVFFLTGGYCPPDGPDSAIEYFNIPNAIKYWELDINWNNIINQTMHWLELWTLLEKECKELGIQTYYMSMRNPYSKEAYQCHFGAPDNDSDATTKSLWFNEYEVLKPYIDSLPINTPNHWHYKNYCGLLEWTLDNYEDINPFQETKDISFEEYLKEQPNGWGHPSPQMMEKFVKEELMPLIYG